MPGRKWFCLRAAPIASKPSNRRRAVRTRWCVAGRNVRPGDATSTAAGNAKATRSTPRSSATVGENGVRPSRLSEEVLAKPPSGRGPAIASRTSTGSEAARQPACKEHLGCRPKTFCRRSPVGRPFGGGTCKEHPGFLEVPDSASSLHAYPSGGRVLKRTSS